MRKHSSLPEGDGQKRERAPSSRGDSSSAAQKRRRPDPQIRSDGARRSRWTSDSGIPQIAPGTLDAAALLGALTEALRPVLDQHLAEMAASLEAVVQDAQDPAAVTALRTDLLRRVLPQFSEAVRGGVIEGIRTRQMHLSQLAVIDRTAHQTDRLTSLRARIDNEIARAGLVRVTEPEDLSLFDLVDPGSLRQGGDEPPVYSVIAPAYTDRESGKLVERGWLSVAYEQPAPAKLTPTPGQKKRQHGERSGKQSPASEMRTADPRSAQNPKAGHRKGRPPGQRPESARVPLVGTEQLHDGAGPGTAASNRSRRTAPPVRGAGAAQPADPVRGPQPTRGPKPALDLEPVQASDSTGAAEAVSRKPTAAPEASGPAPKPAEADRPRQPAAPSKLNLRTSLRTAASKHRQEGSR